MATNWKKMNDQYGQCPNGKVVVLYSTMVVDKETFHKLEDHGEFRYRAVKGPLNLDRDPSLDPNYFLVSPHETGEQNPMEKKEVINILTKSRNFHGKVVLAVQGDTEFALRDYSLYVNGSMAVEDRSGGTRQSIQFINPTKAKPKKRSYVFKDVEMEFDDPETEEFRKWWHISQVGTRVTRQWGAAGKSGESKTENFASEDKATAFVEKMVRQKNQHGYFVSYETGDSIL